jgi:hypothetical protein
VLEDDILNNDYDYSYLADEEQQDYYYNEDPVTYSGYDDQIYDYVDQEFYGEYEDSDFYGEENYDHGLA